MKFTDQLDPIKTPTFIKEGIPNNALADLGKNLLVTGENAYNNYQQGSLRDAVNTNIDEYEENRKGFESGILAAGEQQAIDSMFEKAGDASNAQADVNDVNKIGKLQTSFQGHLQKYEAAARQGKISEEELIARINKTTREYVNKNPWMEAELYQSVREHLRNTGVADILKYRQEDAQASAKSEQDTYNKVRDYLFTNRLGWEPGMPMPAMLTKMNDHMAFKLRVDVMNDVVSGNKAIDADSVRTMAPEIEKTWIQEGIFDFRSQYADKFKALAPDDGKGFIATRALMKAEADDKLNKMKVFLADKNLLGDDLGKSMLKQAEEGYKSTIALIEEAADPKTAAETMRNFADYHYQTKRLQLQKEYDVPAIELANLVGPWLYPSIKDAIISDTTKGGKLDKAVNLLTGILDGSRTQTKPNVDGVKNGNAATVFDLIVSGARTNPKVQGFRQAITTALGNFNETLSSGKIDKDEAHKFSNAVLQSLAKEGEMFRGTPVTPELAGHGQKMIDFTMEKYSLDMFGSAQATMKNRPGVQVKFDVVPGGGLVVRSNSPEVEKAFNEKIVSKINNALDAYAAINGLSREQAAKTFYPNHFGKLLGDKGAEELLKDPDISGSKVAPGTFKLDNTKQGPKDIKQLSEETRVKQKERDSLARQIKTEEYQSVQNSLKANQDALRIAKEKRSDDPKYLKYLENNIKNDIKNIEALKKEMGIQ